MPSSATPDAPIAVNGHVNGSTAANGVSSALATEVTVEEATIEEAAAEEVTAEQPADATALRARGRIRRRARYLRRLREVQLRDIGGLAVELRRFGAARQDLLDAKLAAAVDTDLELRTLERLLGERAARELRLPGIGGACPRCGAVHGSADRFCAACGTALPTGGTGGTTV